MGEMRRREGGEGGEQGRSRKGRGGEYTCHMHVHVCSVIETRQSKASSSFSKRKRRAVSGGIRTCVLGRCSTN